jgi:hypothetical protein
METAGTVTQAARLLEDIEHPSPQQREAEEISQRRKWAAVSWTGLAAT